MFFVILSLCRPNLSSAGSGKPLRVCISQSVLSLSLFLFLSDLEIRIDSSPDPRGRVEGVLARGRGSSLRLTSSYDLGDESAAFQILLGNEGKTLGRGALTCAKNFGVIIGGSPRVAPEGGSDSAGESRGSLSKEKQSYDSNFHYFSKVKNK